MPQSGGDLVSAGYPTTNPFWSLLGGTTQIAQANLPARSNLYFGLGSVSDGAATASGTGACVAIPVSPGDVISKITILVGATAASTPTHAWGALYSGLATPALMGQSADSTTSAIAASAAWTFTLATPQTITSVNCPYGFVYAAYCITASTAPSTVALATPTAATYQWTTNGPLVLSGTFTGAASTAPATMASLTAKAVAPLTLLT